MPGSRARRVRSVSDGWRTLIRLWPCDRLSQDCLKAHGAARSRLSRAGWKQTVRVRQWSTAKATGGDGPWAVRLAAVHPAQRVERVTDRHLTQPREQRADEICARRAPKSAQKKPAPTRWPDISPQPVTIGAIQDDRTRFLGALSTAWPNARPLPWSAPIFTPFRRPGCVPYRTSIPAPTPKHFERFPAPKPPCVAALLQTNNH